jgi:hypothetical protein
MMSKKMQDLPISIQIPVDPIPFLARGKYHLVYELLLHNTSDQVISPANIEIQTAEPGTTTIAVLTAEDISKNVRYLNPELRPAKPQQWTPQNTACVYLWLSLEPEAHLPKRLFHKVRLENSQGKEISNLNILVAVQPRKPLVVSHPLKGQRWVAADGPSNTVGHRRALLPIDGKTYIAQRYAVDWVRFGDDGRLFHDDPSLNQNWYGYGAELLAVADGIVTMAQDGVPENVPLSPERAVEINLESAPGNYLVLQLDDTNYALYAHLLPGSLTVKPGQNVERGQVLGRLGNSGNSDGPHLHFHIGDRNAPLATEGVPYLFDSYQWLGFSLPMEEMDENDVWEPDASVPPRQCSNEAVLDTDVVMFK